MCWRKKPPPPVTNCKKTLLAFAINNYPGGANDLNGCLNDQDDLIAKLKGEYPGEWCYNQFRDEQVTKQNFHNTIKNHIVGMTSGDILLIHYSGHGSQVYDPHKDEADGYDETLYLYDGNFTDDEFNAILQLIPDGAKVIIALDSCFSGSATRLLSVRYEKARFIPPAHKKSLKRRKKYLKTDNMKWIVFSGCREDQTSADAVFAGRYNGAFTYAWLKAFNKGLTYNEWADETIYKIHNYGYDQVPTLEGNSTLINQIVFT